MKMISRALVATLVAVPMWCGAAHATSPLLKEIQDAFIRLHEQVGPAVVNIDTKGKMEGVGQDDFEDLFRFFGRPGGPEGGPGAPGGPGGRREMPRVQGTGSGFIIDKEGHILTNNHVVENADEITVRTYTGKEYPAKLIGRDPDTDIAVIQITPDGELPMVELGNSDDVKVGQFAIAIGSPRQLEGSVSFGHISALGREGLAGLQQQGLRFQNLLQTDAAINLGNSGGPLCDIDGQVVGMNVAIVWGANSIGFAIPINTAKAIIPQLIEKGKVTRGFLGVGISDASQYAQAVSLPDNKGAFVKEIRPDTPAARADLHTYDVIRKVNGHELKNASGLVENISALAPGSEATLEVWRDGKTIEVKVKLDEWQNNGASAEPSHDNALGLEVRGLTDDFRQRLHVDQDVQGVLVTKVVPGSPADDAHLTEGDIILEVGQQKVPGTAEFKKYIDQFGEPGKSVLIRFLRGDQEDITVIRVPSAEK
nr:HtrA protease/chaperone protein [uncultured bacterium]